MKVQLVQVHRVVSGVYESPAGSGTPCGQWGRLKSPAGSGSPCGQWGRKKNHFRNNQKSEQQFYDDEGKKGRKTRFLTLKHEYSVEKISVDLTQTTPIQLYFFILETNVNNE
ncbi:hypothetical protein Btru_054107 [Bulinus truncatus]|nr:hypothetical protein Btru_054107 [Bulinus truncatus]